MVMLLMNEFIVKYRRSKPSDEEGRGCSRRDDDDEDLYYIFTFYEQLYIRYRHSVQTIISRRHQCELTSSHVRSSAGTFPGEARREQTEERFGTSRSLFVRRRRQKKKSHFQQVQCKLRVVFRHFGSVGKTSQEDLAKATPPGGGLWSGSDPIDFRLR